MSCVTNAGAEIKTSLSFKIKQRPARMRLDVTLHCKPHRCERAIITIEVLLNAGRFSYKSFTMNATQPLEFRDKAFISSRYLILLDLKFTFNVSLDAGADSVLSKIVIIQLGGTAF